MNHPTPYKRAKRIFFRELRLAIARKLFGAKPPADSPRYVNIGAGDLYPGTFLNADIFPPLNPSRWKQRAPWLLDIRFPLECDDNYWDGILTEHTIEHVKFHEAANFLAEAFRTLKPGGWIRISVPDVSISIKNYLLLKEGGNLPAVFVENMQWNNCKGPADQIDHTVNEWGHESLWDYERLETVLKGIGFTNIKEVTPETGSDEKLIIKQDAFRVAESVYVEAQKPVL